MTSKALKDQQPAVRLTSAGWEGQKPDYVAPAPLNLNLIPPFKDRAEDLAATVAAEKAAKSAAKDLALEERAWAAWDAAWDRARNADTKAGRRYDRAKYAERAHAARIKVLNIGLGLELSTKLGAAE